MSACEVRRSASCDRLHHLAFEEAYLVEVVEGIRAARAAAGNREEAAGIDQAAAGLEGSHRGLVAAAAGYEAAAGRRRLLKR